MIAEAEHGCVGEGPREIRVADRRPGGASACPRRCLGALDEAAGGHDIVPPGEAGEVMDGIQEHETADLADARDRLVQGEGVGIVLRRRLHTGQRQVRHIARPPPARWGL